MSLFGTRYGTRFGSKYGTQYPADPSGVAPPIFTGILDTIVAAGDPAPGLALGVRRLFSSYTGEIMTVRSAAGGTDGIGYNADGSLDTAAIAALCGANDGFMTLWNDQSGNARNHDQSTTAEQPKIYDGATGQVLVDGVAGLPAPTFSRAAVQSLGAAGFLNGAGAYTVAFISRGTTTAYQVMETHSPLRIGVIGANNIAYLTTGAPQRQYTPVTAITTLAGYISTFAASATIGAVPLEQNGSNLAQASVANGATAVSFTTTDSRVGSETDASAPSLQGVVAFRAVWGVQLSATSITALRDFNADNI